jgi:Xaa-Pro dipeptidase
VIDIAKARAIMQEKKLDVLIISTPENFYYTTGVYPLECDMIKDHVRYAVIPKEDIDPFIVVPDYEAQLFGKWGQEVIDFVSEKYIKGGSGKTPVAEQYISKSDLQALEMVTLPESVLLKASKTLAGVLKARGLDKGVLGVERRQRADVSNELRAALPDAVFKNGSIVLNEFRLIKSKEEIDHIREATRITENALKTAIDEVKVGTKMADLKVLIKQIMCADVDSGPIELGVGTWFFSPANHVVREGDIARFDLGARYKYYCSDVSRQVAIGRIPKDWEKLFDTFLEAEETIISMVKPGAMTDELFEAGMEIVRRVDPDYERGHLGHGIGIELHEAPHIAPKPDGEPLRTNMVFTVEIPYYVAGTVGFNCEDILVVTDHGCEVLSSLSKELYRK